MENSQQDNTKVHHHYHYDMNFYQYPYFNPYLNPYLYPYLYPYLCPYQTSDQDSTNKKDDYIEIDDGNGWIRVLILKRPYTKYNPSPYSKEVEYIYHKSWLDSNNETQKVQKKKK